MNPNRVGFAKPARPIAQVTELLQRDLFPIEVVSREGDKRGLTKGAFLFDGDRFTVRLHQWLSLTFNDGSTIKAGPHTVIRIGNWSKRNGQGYLMRRIFLEKGTAEFWVKRLHSDAEPFRVITPTSIVEVKGTRFVVSAIPERLNRVAKTEVVHVITFEGEVFLSKSPEKATEYSSHSLETPDDVVAAPITRILPGYYASVYPEVSRSTYAQRYILADVNELLKARLPQVTAPTITEHSYATKAENITNKVLEVSAQAQAQVQAHVSRPTGDNRTPASDSELRTTAYDETRTTASVPGSDSELRTTASVPTQNPFLARRKDKARLGDNPIAISESPSALPHTTPKAFQQDAGLQWELTRSRALDNNPIRPELEDLEDVAQPRPVLPPGLGPAPDSANAFRHPAGTSLERLYQGNSRRLDLKR